MTTHAAAGFIHYARAGQLSDSRPAGAPVEALCGTAFVPGLPIDGAGAHNRVCPGCDESFGSTWPVSTGRVGRPRTVQRSVGIRLVD